MFQKNIFFIILIHKNKFHSLCSNNLSYFFEEVLGRIINKKYTNRGARGWARSFCRRRGKSTFCQAQERRFFFSIKELRLILYKERWC